MPPGDERPDQLPVLSQYPWLGKAVIARQKSPLRQSLATGSQTLRQVPGAAEPAHTRPGAHSVVVLQAAPSPADAAGQTHDGPWFFTR